MEEEEYRICIGTVFIVSRRIIYTVRKSYALSRRRICIEIFACLHTVNAGKSFFVRTRVLCIVVNLKAVYNTYVLSVFSVVAYVEILSFGGSIYSFRFIHQNTVYIERYRIIFRILNNYRLVPYVLKCEKRRKISRSAAVFTGNAEVQHFC